MILFVALIAAAPVIDTPGGPAARYEACVALTKSDPAAAVEQANAWRERSGGLPAGQCLGLAFAAQERWAPAAAAFEQSAREAEQVRDGRAATLWTQAGNAALAGDDPAKARGLLDRALALPVLAGQMRGEALLDRARADAALKDMSQTRADLDQAAKLVPADPFLWLLSATLARHQNDLPRAQRDIAEAQRLAADDGSVAYEAGNIAAVSGRPDAAKQAWTQAVALDKGGPAGTAAAALLAQDGAATTAPKLDYDALKGD